MKHLLATGLSVALMFGCVTLTGCAQSQTMATATPGPNTPGWTGRTIVPGSSSSLAKDSEATYYQQKWPFSDFSN
ncbi:MAG TPA: hypothetical protein VHO91_11925 [Rhodopila sp.]|nr:hypothetical protein [Rhodopila sp.]